MPWSTPFDDPMPHGIETLLDAGQFIMALPKAEQAKAHWLAAAEAVLMAAEGRGPVIHARIGMLRALNHGKPREFTDTGKKHHWGRNKLKRDE